MNNLDTIEALAARWTGVLLAQQKEAERIIPAGQSLDYYLGLLSGFEAAAGLCRLGADNQVYLANLGVLAVRAARLIVEMNGKAEWPEALDEA